MRAPLPSMSCMASLSAGACSTSYGAARASEMPGHGASRLGLRSARASTRLRRGSSIRSSYERDTDRQRRAPEAPPLRAPPPPPPPPPPPDAVPELQMPSMSRRLLFAIMAGGALVWNLALRAGLPLAGYDASTGVALLRTAGGNLVAATRDEAGNVFMYDKAGNIYYDTGPEQGVYIVDAAGEMFNSYADLGGAVKRTYVGNIRDLRTFKVQQIGGVPVQDLAKSIEGLRDGKMTAFAKKADRRRLPDYMPPNAPLTRDKAGRLAPPPMLEDNELRLEKKGGLFSGRGNDLSLGELVRSLKIE